MRLSETFRSRSIFLSHDNASSKFDKHPISIDLIGYKNTNKLIVQSFSYFESGSTSFCVKYINTSITSEFTEFTDHIP